MGKNMKEKDNDPFSSGALTGKLGKLKWPRFCNCHFGVLSLSSPHNGLIYSKWTFFILFFLDTPTYPIILQILFYKSKEEIPRSWPWRLLRIFIIGEHIRSEKVLMFDYRFVWTWNPRSMNHLSGPSPWTPSWTRSMNYPCGPPLICKDDFY